MSTQQTSSFASPETSSSSLSGNNNNSEEISTTNDSSSNEKLLQLPPSDPNKNGDIKTLKMGESLKLDHLGPIILNTDGTTRRIDNWDTLTEREKEVTWRRIRKRNEERRNILEAEQQQQVEMNEDTKAREL